MITINLLPKERRKVGTNWLFNLSVALITLLLVGGMILATLFANVLVATSSREARSIQKELNARKEVLALVDQLEAQKRILDEKEKIIATLVDRRIEWGKKLQELAELIPDKVWLERIQLETKLVREKVEEKSDPKSAGSSRRPTRPKQIEIRTDYLHIFACTNDLRQKSFLQGEFIRSIQQKESFFADFVDVNFKEGKEANWLERDESSPKVWRFQLTLKLRELEPPRTL